MGEQNLPPFLLLISSERCMLGGMPQQGLGYAYSATTGGCSNRYQRIAKARSLVDLGSYALNHESYKRLLFEIA